MVEVEHSGSPRESTPVGRVLMFGLADDRYCLDVQYVSEVLADRHLLSIPAADPVVGVFDLRGTTVTVVDPKVPLALDGDAAGSFVVVLPFEYYEHVTGQYAILVDEVYDVVPASELDPVDAPAPGEPDYRVDGDPVTWIDPHDVVVV